MRLRFPGIEFGPGNYPERERGIMVLARGVVGGAYENQNPSPRSG
jgi:hypothetical protein